MLLKKKEHPGGMGDNDSAHRGMKKPDISRPETSQCQNKP